MKTIALLVIVLIASIQLLGCATTSPGEIPYKVIAQITTGDNPHGIWFNPQGDRAYVACSGSDRIDVIDCTTHELIESYPGGSVPLDVLGSADGQWLILTQFRSVELQKMSVQGGEIVQLGTIGNGGSLFSPRIVNDRAYLVCEFSDELVVFNRRTLEIEATYATGDRPYPCDVTRDGRYAYVPNREDSNVSVIELATGNTVAEIAVGADPQGGALTTDDRTYLVAESGQNSIGYLDAKRNVFMTRVSEGVGARPFSVAVTRDGRWALVNNAGGDSISVLDIKARRIIGDIVTGEQPIVVRQHPTRDEIYVSNEVSGTVTVLGRIH